MQRLIHSQKRFVSQITRVGSGGRSSVSGISATVFGATGFLGRYVVNRLGKMGSQVIIPYRGEQLETRHLRPMGDLGQILFCDFQLFDVDSVRRLVQNSNVVINLIGQDYNSRHFSIDDVNIHGARIIAEAARDAGVERLIHLSALGADDQSPSHFLRSKAQGEQAVLDTFPDATIIRPANVFGPEDRFFNKFASYTSIPFAAPVPNDGLSLKRPVYSHNVADGILATLKSDDHIGKVFEFYGPKQYTVKQLLEYTFRTIHIRQRIVPVPQQILEVVGQLLELSPVSVPITTKDEIIRLAANDVFTGVAGLEDLGITPTALEQVALTFLRKFRNHLFYEQPVQLEDGK